MPPRGRTPKKFTGRAPAPSLESPGHRAYLAFGNTVEWVGIDGSPMATWEDLPQQYRWAWSMAARAIVGCCRDRLQDVILEET